MFDNAEHLKEYHKRYNAENRERIRQKQHERYLRTIGQGRQRQERHERPDYCGIYGIKCEQTGEWYVGQSLDVIKRWNTHLRQLMRGEHENRKLQDAFTNYGITGFGLTVLCLCSPDELNTKEREYVNEYDSQDNGMNLYMPTIDDE